MGKLKLYVRSKIIFQQDSSGSELKPPATKDIFPWFFNGKTQKSVSKKNTSSQLINLEFILNPQSTKKMFVLKGKKKADGNSAVVIQSLYVLSYFGALRLAYNIYARYTEQA